MRIYRIEYRTFLLFKLFAGFGAAFERKQLSF